MSSAFCPVCATGANVNLQDEDGDTALHITLGVQVKNPEVGLFSSLVKQNSFFTFA